MKQIFLFLLVSCITVKLAAQITCNKNDPSICGGKDGKITIEGVSPKIVYSITYVKNDTKENSIDTADDSGNLKLQNLSSGIYKNIKIMSKGENPVENTIPDSILLGFNCIAQQKSSFLAAAFQNFTGVQDDNPENYTQINAYISQPLNKAQGIRNNSKRRFIWFRNGMFQITYGNTDKFKLYSYDTLNTKYVNKLDLLAHSYLNANASLNIITYVLGENWKLNSGDMAHIYLDLYTSLILTNVSDTSVNSSTPKTYNVKSNTYGVALNAKFNNAFDSKFTIKAGWKLFWIFPSSSSLSGSLNPQNNNIVDIYSSQNSGKCLALVKELPYITFEVMMQYNTSMKPNDNSNIFLHYAYTSNYANQQSSNFYNNYFQFQIGYAMEITDIFKKDPSSKSDTKEEITQ